MTFRNSRGRRATALEVLQEREQQRRGIVAPQAAPRGRDVRGIQENVLPFTTVNTWGNTPAGINWVPTGTTQYFINEWSNTTTGRTQWFTGDFANTAVRNTQRFTEARTWDVAADTFQDAAAERLRREIEENLAATIRNEFIAPMADFAITARTRPTPQRTPQPNRGPMSRSAKVKEKYLPLYRNVMACGVEYTGKTFIYRLNVETGLGSWYIIGCDTSIVDVDLSTVTIVSISLPEISGRLQNLARYFWRMLDIEAVRYKDRTIISVENAKAVLRAGESYTFPSGTIESVIAGTGQINLNLTQGELFYADSESGINLNNKSKLKPVYWINYRGNRLNNNYYPDGEAIDYNYPRTISEEADGDSE